MSFASREFEKDPVAVLCHRHWDDFLGCRGETLSSNLMWPTIVNQIWRTFFSAEIHRKQAGPGKTFTELVMQYDFLAATSGTDTDYKIKNLYWIVRLEK